MTENRTAPPSNAQADSDELVRVSILADKKLWDALWWEANAQNKPLIDIINVALKEAVTRYMPREGTVHIRFPFLGYERGDPITQSFRTPRRLWADLLWWAAITKIDGKRMRARDLVCAILAAAATPHFGKGPPPHLAQGQKGQLKQSAPADTVAAASSTAARRRRRGKLKKTTSDE